MEMIIAYIAHPIGGDVENNLNKIRSIVREVNLTNAGVVPFVPYYADCVSLDDDVPYERERGIINDVELFNRGFIDEVWLYGDRISNGMRAEVELALSLGITVVPQTSETKTEYLRMINKDLKKVNNNEKT